MEYRIRRQPEEWACTKFCRISLEDDSIAEFIRWLCDHSREQTNIRLRARSEDDVVWYDPVESMWMWDAPRHRTAMLLWRAVHGNASAEEFHRRFCFPTPLQMHHCGPIIAPVQERLKWVMEGLFSRKAEDDRLGQGDWGERWWLPDEQSEFLRAQLTKTHAALIEQSSDYEDAVSLGLSYFVRHVVQVMPVPSPDPQRIYLGERRGPHDRVFVWIEDTQGHRYPLPRADSPYREADGTGFEWGYGGHGPGALTKCILADACDGDLVLAEELDFREDGFFEKFILDHPRDEDLRISRTAVMEWLASVEKLTLFEQRKKLVAERAERYKRSVAERLDLLARIQQTGGLRSQRFDIVPENFEAALYLDLMRMLESGSIALRCTGCGMPIPYDHSGRANKQRARSKKGESIYHPDCFADATRARKKAYWQRRSSSPKFRDAEKRRAREYRRQS